MLREFDLGLLCFLPRKKHIPGVERHSNWLVLPIRGLFVIKIALVIGAYILILLFLIRKLGLIRA
jgi:hypothetical protein